MKYQTIDEEWEKLSKELPDGWEQAARDTGAIRINKGPLADPGVLLRLVLGHAASCRSFRGVVGHARQTGLADISDVALLKRERRCGDFLEWIADRLLSETLAILPDSAMRLRLVDATSISRTGGKGTDFRLHVNVELPGRRFTEAELTDAHGGESFKRFTVQPGDLLVGDRCYGTENGIRHVVRGQGDVLVRVNASSLPLFDGSGRRVDPLEVGRGLAPGQATELPVRLRGEAAPGQPLVGRLCVQALPEKEALKAQERVKRSKGKKGKRAGARAIESAKYVFLFTTAAQEWLTAEQGLAVYRLRWQVELSFKTLKSVMKFGLLPNRLPETGRTWLLAKLVCALLLDRLRENRVHSPLGEVPRDIPRAAIAIPAHRLPVSGSRRRAASPAAAFAARRQLGRNAGAWQRPQPAPA